MGVGGGSVGEGPAWWWSRPACGLCWLEAHLLLCAAGLRGLGLRKGLLSHHSPEHRGILGAGLLPPARLATAGIQDGLMLRRQGLEKSHRGMCPWEQHSEEGRALLVPGQGLLSGVQNPLARWPVWPCWAQEPGAGRATST